MKEVAGPASEEGRKQIRRNMAASSSFKLRCSTLNTLRLRRVFDLFDKNGDGLITVKEISQALLLLGLEADPSELHSIITSFIKPGNDALTFDDFHALHKSLNDAFFPGDDQEGDDMMVMMISQLRQESNHHRHHEEETSGSLPSQVESDLTEAFKVFDENGDGYISAKELQVVLEKLGLSEANEMERVELMISSADQNQDGRVDFLEFKDMMFRSVLVPSS